MRTPAASPRPRPTAADSDVEDVRLGPVLEPEGRALLDALGDVAGQDPLALSGRLRREGHPPERVAAVLTQAGLRAKARTKLGDLADGMLFTREGLEQATRFVVAQLHAERLAAAGARHVADLGCGLGVDALAHARAGLRVSAVERDPGVAAAARVNLADCADARVVEADAVAWAREHVGLGAAGDVDALWLDPARRRIGRGTSARVFDPEAFSPPLSTVLELARTGMPIGVKLGPGIPHEAVPEEAEAQWISVDGDVTEVVLWFNGARRAGVRRSALALDTRTSGGDDGVGRAELTSTAPAGGSPEVDAVGEEGMAGLEGHVLLEPDGAVIRAGLVTDLARALGPDTRLLDPHLAYLAAPEAAAHPLARRYRVLAVRDYHVKSLRRWARETGVTRLDVKKRGVRETPEEVRRHVLGGKAGRGATDGRHATLVLARVGERRFALEVEPLDGR